jgi:mono/diheme cytochrome c family protein
MSFIVMSSRIFDVCIGGAATVRILAVCALLGGLLAAAAQTAKIEAPKPAPDKPTLLVWDATTKEMTPEPTAEIIAGTAQFVFNVTNVSDQEVVIERMAASCGCTTIRMPAEPWHIAPHESGKVEVSVTYAGKMGVFFKTIAVISPTAPATLNVKINFPPTPQMARDKNRGLAEKDRQAVFKGDCAVCHADKAHGKTGKELYIAACGICHEAAHRATMVPNLHTLNKATDYNYWKEWISNGKTNSLMPAFAISAGGPLSEEQIDSLAKTLVMALPPQPRGAPAGRTVNTFPRPNPLPQN